jgi:hypothetical protein
MGFDRVTVSRTRIKVPGSGSRKRKQRPRVFVHQDGIGLESIAIAMLKSEWIGIVRARNERVAMEWIGYKAGNGMDGIVGWVRLVVHSDFSISRASYVLVH